MSYREKMACVNLNTTCLMVNGEWVKLFYLMEKPLTVIQRGNLTASSLEHLDMVDNTEGDAQKQ